MPRPKRINQTRPVQSIQPSEDPRTNFNLPVIQRLVPSCTRIVSQASYCNVYEIINASWEKPEIEGPLFLLETTSSHRYYILILNRKSPINLLVPLPKKTDCIELDEIISIMIDDEEFVGTGGEPKVYGLRVFSEEGMSTAGDKKRIEQQIIALVAEEAEREEARLEQEQLQSQLQQQQHHQQQQPPHPQILSEAQYTQLPSQDVPPIRGRRISLSELFGNSLLR